MVNIIFLGLVSFFADVSSEMVYPLIPLYLTSAFGATPALVGVIEGIAESLASLLKVFSGYITDRYKKKKPIAFCGYATGLLYKLALIFASSWLGILGARVIDRLGKGIRTAPRDVMVSESASKDEMGKAFGVHKALDMAGSALGILLSYFLLTTMQDQGGFSQYKTIFAISAIPSILALCMFFFVKEKNTTREVKQRESIFKNVKLLKGNLKLFLLVAAVFTLGNSSNTFLLLRAKDVGFTDTSVILLYFVYNIVASILAIPFGKRSDKAGRKRILVIGYFVFSFVYLGFAFATAQWMIVAIFVLYGIYTAMTAGVERAFIAEISPKNLKGTMLGLHSTIVGITLFPASTIAGFLWNGFGASAPFLYGAVLSALAALLLIFFLKEKKVSK